MSKYESISKGYVGDLLAAFQRTAANPAITHEDYAIAGRSFKIESIIDIGGILVAYPFYLLSMYHIRQGTKPSEVDSAIFDNMGSLSAFVGVLCGISFTSAAGIPMKEMLSTQERERKLQMLGKMYQQILRALVVQDLSENKSVDQIQQKISDEIDQTEKHLNTLRHFIAQKQALSKSESFANNLEERDKNENEIFEDIRMLLVYEQRLAFLNKLRKTVQYTKAKSFIEIEINAERDTASRDILVELHRPAYDMLPFDTRIFARAKPIENINGAGVFNHYGVPAARIHYQELVELIAKRLVNDAILKDINAKKTAGNQYLKNTHLEGFFTNPDAQAYINHILNLAPDSTSNLIVLENQINTKKIELAPYEDIFNNYGIRKSTSHYAVLIELIEKLLAHKKPGDNNEHWIAMGKHYLKDTILENFFQNPNAPHVKELFARAKNQQDIYRNSRALDAENTDEGINLDEHTTHKIKQKIHAKDLVRDIVRKKAEIKFYENKFNILNPLNEPNTAAIDINYKPTTQTHDSSANNLPPADIKAPEEEHIYLEHAYGTQLKTQVKIIGAEIAELFSKVKYFYNSMVKNNFRPNKHLRAESKKTLETPHLPGKFSALWHYYVVYHYQRLLAFFALLEDNLDTDFYNLSLWAKPFAAPFFLIPYILIRLIHAVPLIPYFVLFLFYKASFAFMNGATLLKTLQYTVDALHMGVRNLDESLNVTLYDSVAKQIFFPIFKAILLAPVSVFEFGFGMAYWLLGPLAKDSDLRKITRAITMESHAKSVDAIYDWLDKHPDSSMVWAAGMVIKFIIWATLPFFGVANWFYTVLTRALMCVPLISWAFYEISSADNTQKHDIARRKVSEALSTIGTSLHTLWIKFFVQPFKDNWDWFITNKNELDKKYNNHFYGYLGPKTKYCVKGLHFAVLCTSWALATILNGVFGVIKTIIALMKFAPLLTFISFTLSTLSAGFSFAALGFSFIPGASTSGKLLAVPMALEPINSTHDLYNNASFEEYDKENIKLKEPVEKYRKYIRNYIKGKLSALLAISKKHAHYQDALAQLEERAYSRLPKIPMGVYDVNAYLSQLLPDTEIKTLTLGNKLGNLQKQDIRNDWDTECVNFAVHVKRGKEIFQNNPIENNTRACYKNYLAKALADQFTHHGAHDDYFTNHHTLETALDYFYQQNRIDPAFIGSNDYQRDVKYAFAAFTELVVHRFIKIAADDRYHKALDKENNASRFFYIDKDKNGAAIPCSESFIDGKLILTLADGKTATFRPKNFFTQRFLTWTSKCLDTRYDFVSGSDGISAASFVYSEGNNRVDLNLCLSALEKDFGDVKPAVQAPIASAASHNDISTEDEAKKPHSSSTARPINTLFKYSTGSASAQHLNRVYEHKATFSAQRINGIN